MTSREAGGIACSAASIDSAKLRADISRCIVAARSRLVPRIPSSTASDRPRIVSATRISIKVKPASPSLGSPIGDCRFRPAMFPRIVGTVAVEVVVAVFAGRVEIVRMPPGVGDTGALLYVGPVPVFRTGRHGNQGLQALLGGGIAPHIIFEEIQSGFQIAHLGFGGAQLCTVE